MKLTNSQLKVVQNLFEAFKKQDQYKYATFKAPTGSGKTFMSSELISRILEYQFLNQRKAIFVVATVSSSELPKSFAKKLKDYQKYHQFQNYTIDYISSPSGSKSSKIENIPEFNLENNKVFVFGVSSFGKNTLFFQNKTLETFLFQVKIQNYDLFFIRDEAHIGKKENIAKNDLKNFDEKLKDAANFIIEMTATPKNSKNLIELTLEDLENDDLYLLKNKAKMLDEKGKEFSNSELIDYAIEKFQSSKKEYQNIKKYVINPAMLIQILNDADIKKSKEKHLLFKENLALLENKLTKAGLKYLKYIDNNPIVVNTKAENTLEYASKLNSEIDVIIFKVGPATGWDIPRANTLLQLRNVSSEFLNIQTLGRIMRNSHPDLENNKITRKYYLWSNYQKPSREASYYKLRDKFKNINFFAGYIDRTEKKLEPKIAEYIKDVANYINSDFENKIKDFNIENIVYNNEIFGQTKIKNKIPNFIRLKIYNESRFREIGKDLKIDYFNILLNKKAKELKKNIEIIKYIFYDSINIIKEKFTKYSKWIYEHEFYKIKNQAKPLNNYTLWKSNIIEKNVVNTKEIENYGYRQIISNHNEKDSKFNQYFDSTPEKEFFNSFRSATSKKKLKNITFFAKMPTLGSGVYFEYFSHVQNKIVKSYIDFAIKYKSEITNEEKIIMIESKSKNEDYDSEKTDDLLKGYEMYIKNNLNKNLVLLLHKYDTNQNIHYFYGYINNEWQESKAFVDILDEILN